MVQQQCVIVRVDGVLSAKIRKYLMENRFVHHVNDTLVRVVPQLDGSMLYEFSAEPPCEYYALYEENDGFQNATRWHKLLKSRFGSGVRFQVTMKSLH